MCYGGNDYGPGTHFRRNSNRAVKWGPGVEISWPGGSVELNAMSGFSRWVRVGYALGEHVSPLREAHPLRGYRVAPRSGPAGERGAELVFVLRARRPGRYVTKGVRLDYSVGGEEHSRKLPNAFAACVVSPGTKLPRDCPLPPQAPWDLCAGRTRSTSIRADRSPMLLSQGRRAI